METSRYYRGYHTGPCVPVCPCIRNSFKSIRASLPSFNPVVNPNCKKHVQCQRSTVCLPSCQNVAIIRNLFFFLLPIQHISKGPNHFTFKSCWVDNGYRLDFNDLFTRPPRRTHQHNENTTKFKVQVVSITSRTQNPFSSEEETKNKHTEHWIAFSTTFIFEEIQFLSYFQSSLTLYDVIASGSPPMSSLMVCALSLLRLLLLLLLLFWFVFIVASCELLVASY